MEGWVPLGDTGSNNPNHSRLIKLPDQLDTMKKIKITKQQYTLCTFQTKQQNVSLPRALENLLDTGEVGIHEFANSVYAVAGHGEEQEMMESKGEMESDNGTNCSDGGCSDESYEGEAADFEAGSGFGQQRQYSFFGGRHGPPPPR